ncbi:MAG: SDR family NAD(P)-dependent oxidoreductase [Caulobacteraceae bacterium]
MRDLAGKVAVITGGASGIGLAMAEAFAAAGMKLVLADIEAGALARAVEQLTDAGAEAIGVPANVARQEELEALAERTVAQFGKAHLVVLNAGVSITGPIWGLSLDDWRWVLDVNLWGVIHGIRAFTPLQLAHGEEGHTVITASEAAFLGIGYHAPYCASKAAVLSIGLALHSELLAAASRIGVSVVCPGMVATQIHRSWRNRPVGDQPWSGRERSAEGIAYADAFQGRGVPPEEIAKVTLEAIRDNRFLVFNTPHWKEMIGHIRDVELSGENPPVYTWGPDLRPKPIQEEQKAAEVNRPARDR